MIPFEKGVYSMWKELASNIPSEKRSTLQGKKIAPKRELKTVE